jgi:hypothetical protein
MAVGAPFAHAGPLTDYADWTVDRVAPSAFANIGTFNDRSDVLQVDIAGADQQVGTFGNNQGRGSQIVPNVGEYAVIYGSLFVPGEWQTSTGASDIRSTALWGFAVNGVDDPAQGNSHYPIVGFTNSGGDASGDTAAGTGRIRVFDSNSGWMPSSNQPVQYNAWNNLCLVLSGGTVQSYVNGALAYTQSDLSLPSANADRFNNLVINTYNSGSDYSAQWSNIGAGKLNSIAVSSGSGQSAPAGTAFDAPLMVEALDAGGAPLPCVPVTFTAPDSGASTLQTATTVLTDYRGRASFTARANGVTGRYAIAASAPGVEQSLSLDLTNSPAAVSEAAKPVPSMSQWSMALLGLLLTGMAAVRLRRRNQ